MKEQLVLLATASSLQAPTNKLLMIEIFVLTLCKNPVFQCFTYFHIHQYIFCLVGMSMAGRASHGKTEVRRPPIEYMRHCLKNSDCYIIGVACGLSHKRNWHRTGKVEHVKTSETSKLETRKSRD